PVTHPALEAAPLVDVGVGGEDPLESGLQLGVGAAHCWLLGYLTGMRSLNVVSTSSALLPCHLATSSSVMRSDPSSPSATTASPSPTSGRRARSGVVASGDVLRTGTRRPRTSISALPARAGL